MIHMNSSMHFLAVLTSSLEIAWVQGDFITVQMSRITGHLIFGKQFKPRIRVGKINSWIAVYTLFLYCSYDLLLPFEESILGGKREISISRHETCGACHGSGAKSSNSITECTQCRGQGRSMKSQRTPFGIVSQISSCLNCDGSGKIITEHCPSCDGSGKVQVERSIQVDIPGGIEDGSAIRITGGGSVDKQRGVSGDLYIFVCVEEKQGIHREGLDLCSDVTIDCTDAILGTTVK
uniref:CR-type domain-containing protein n=1 Tax=Aegilops tauschii subsp. strangulata TaxID=200361 RepID=A0A453IM05_AEGTS